MKEVVYEQHFNGNEWFVIALIEVGFAAVLLLLKRFTPTQAAFHMLIGITFGLIFDHTLGVPPIDLYDLGDSSKYELFDIFSYAMYAPYGYLFIYAFERMNVQGIWVLLYIALWTGLAIGIEWAGVQVGLFHYKNGYRLLYSIPIYLFLQSLQLGLHKVVFSKRRSV